MTSSLFEQYKAALRRGHLAVLAGELEEALAAYDEAGRLAPERALPPTSRGTVLHRLQRWPEAVAAFDQALQLAPEDEAALRARATARAERGLRTGAASDFERLAFVLDVAGRPREAADAARHAADLEPSASRQALADRLGAAAGLGAAPVTGVAPDWPSGNAAAPESEPTGDDGEGGLEVAWAAMAERATEGPTERERATEAPTERERATEAPTEQALEARTEQAAEAPTEGEHAPDFEPAPAIEPEETATHRGPDEYDALQALRAGIAAEEGEAFEGTPLQTTPEASPASGSGTPPDPAEPAAASGPADAAGDDQAWPGIDLPSPPPPPVDATLDPEALLAEAALVLESGEVEAARDLMLTAARIHREAGRIDAALETCLNLLSIAPGDPAVHLAIANLQLDRGWMPVATEKLDLLVRLTSLTGDTQAAADVHGLASERLRDELVADMAGG